METATVQLNVCSLYRYEFELDFGLTRRQFRRTAGAGDRDRLPPGKKLGGLLVILDAGAGEILWPERHGVREVHASHA